MICIMKSLTKNKLRCNVNDFAKRLHKWVNNGFKEVGDKFGIGIGRTVGSVIEKKDFFKEPHKVSKEVWEDSKQLIAANGGVMRTSVISIVKYENLEVVKRNSIDFCMVTHYDPRCVASCICINVILSLMLQNADYEKILNKAFNESINFLKENTYDVEEFIKFSNVNSIQDLNLSEGSSIGYTYKCMGCGIYAFRRILKHMKEKDIIEFDYKSLFDEITMECGDADTNLTVVGAICGCYIGFKKLDINWLNSMPEKWFLDKNVGKFLQLLGFDKKIVKQFLKTQILKF